MSKRRFKVASLLAAGIPLVGLGADAFSDEVTEGNNGSDSLLDVSSSIQTNQAYTLAGHSSHASHGSHGSHGSHSSYVVPPYGPGHDEVLSLPEEQELTRNLDSTPNKSVLPSSPALMQTQKALRGNTTKFRETVSRVQVALASSGYDVGSLDGTLDARTMASIYRYQEEHNLIPTGSLNDQTVAMLGILIE